MNLLSLILIALALIVVVCVFYVAWELSSGHYDVPDKDVPNKKEPGEEEESKGSPDS